MPAVASPVPNTIGLTPAPRVIQCRYSRLVGKFWERIAELAQSEFRREFLERAFLDERDPSHQLVPLVVGEFDLPLS